MRYRDSIDRRGQTMPQSERPRQERRPRQARSSRQGSGRQHQQQGRRLRGRHDTGYSLQSHNINFRDGRSLPDRRLLLLGGIAIVIVILLLVLVSSCIRGCTSNKDETVDVDQTHVWPPAFPIRLQTSLTPLFPMLINSRKLLRMPISTRMNPLFS